MALSFISNRTTFAVTTSTQNLTISGSQKSWTITVDEGKDTPSTFDLTIKNTGSKNARVDNVQLVVVTAAAGSSTPVVVKTLKGIAVSGMTVSYEVGNTFSFDGTCTATYSVTRDDEVQPDENKTVTPTSVTAPDMSTTGNKTITVSYTEDDVTKTTTYDITVSAALPKITIDGSATGITTTDEEQDVTAGDFSFGGTFKQYSTTALWFTSGTGFIYNKESFGKIRKITINYKSGGSATSYQWIKLGNAVMDEYEADATNGTEFTTSTGGSSNTFVVTGDYEYFCISISNKNLQASSIVISYEPVAVPVKKPTFTVAEGPYLGAQSVGITCATEGATIYYTMGENPADPTSASTEYAGAIAVDATTTIKAIAIKGSDESAIASATYTIVTTEHAGTELDPYSVADAKAVIDGIGTKADAYVSGKVSQVDSYSEQYHSITYWISADGTTSGQQLQVYSGKGIGGDNFSSVDDVVAKATVVVKGTLKKHYDTYEFDYNNELVSYEAPAEPIVTLSPSSLNLEAEGNGTQEITLTATNFENEVNEITCAFYNTAACDGEAISQPAWITNLTDNNSNQVSFDVEDNDGEARQVWMKVTASDGTNEAYAVLAIAQAKYTVDYATLPFEFDGGRADIENKNGMTQNGLGTDYNNSPKLKFDGTGDYVVIKINNAPGTLTYDIKGNSFSGSTFTVQKSEDGTNYTDIKTYTALGDKQSESIDNIGQAIRYVKFIYTEKVQNGGNVALGNITISEYVAPAVKPTITTQPVGAAYTKDDPADALTIVAEAGNGGTLHYQWYSNTTQSTEGASTIGTDAATYTPSTDALGTIYYYCVVTEEGADEPTTSNIVAIAVSESMPATVTYELFSGDLVEGDYVLVFATRNNAMMASQTLNANRLDYAVVSPSENKLVNPDAALVWHIAPISETDYWTIYSADAEKYAASTNAKNQATLADGDLTDNMKWAVTVSAGKYDFENIARSSGTDPNNKWLRNNDDGTNHYGFACYASGTGTALTLYKKKIEGQPATPTFSKPGSTYTSAQSVELSCATEGAAIYYTTDGITTPTSESTLYEGSINVNESMTIKAIAIKNEIASDVASATYTIVAIEHEGTEDDPYTIADARNAIDVYGELSDKYVAGIISQVDSYNSNYNSITYWISADGETTSPQLQVYSGKGLNGADFSSKSDLQAGDIVIVKGALKLHNNSVYEFDYNNQLVSLVKPAVPTVTLKQSDVIVTALNVEATEVANQEIDIVCANFESQITSVSAKLYEESTCETEITSGAWVTDITIDGAKLTFNIADNTGAARQVWMKVTASDGTDEASAVLAISQAKSAYAALPFAFNGGKSDVVNTNGMSHNGLGSDYNSGPKLKFDNTDDYLIIRINEAPGTLTYDIKNNGFSGGTFTVQESADGETYTEVASHTEIENTQNEEVDLKEATRYVKFIYTEKVAGNVGLGNITISKYVAPTYTEVRNGLNAGEYYTMCLDKAVTAVRGGSIWRVLSKAQNGTDIILEEVTGTLDAGRPYIFYATAVKLEVVYSGTAVNDPVTTGNNGLIGSFEQVKIAQSDDHYIIYNNELYYVNSDNVYVGAHRAYLDMTDVPNYSNEPQQGNAPRRRVTMAVHGPQVATGIDALNASDAPAKVLINGQLFIIRGEKMFDAKGQLVK